MKNFFKHLIGGGGLFKSKPKQSATVKPVSDTARSISYGEVIEVLCSGGKYGIKGLLSPDSRQSVYLDDTPIYTEGYVPNFKGIEIYERKGQPLQQVLSNFTQGLISEHLVSSEVKYGIPVTRNFINQNTNRLRIRLSFVILKNVKDSQGTVTNVIGDVAVFKVYIKEGAGGFVDRGNFSVTGKYSQPYERVWWFDVNPAVDEYYIRVEKVSNPDTEDEKRTINFISYSISANTLLPLKRMAYIGLKFNAEDLGTSIPERKYEVGGMLLDIPSNATINPGNGSLNYSGFWDGTFKAELNTACSDFLAIVWYLLTDEIDGMGDEIKPHMVDRYSLYEVSKYNNQLVDNGFGTVEQRYIFNLLISNQNDGWKVLDSLCSGCNTRYFWQDGLLTFTQDRPSKAVGLVSNADVENGVFVYSTIDLSEISTAVQVTYTDAQTGKTKHEFVSDVQLINKYGYKFKQIEAVGCTRRSQAIRLGRSVIYADNLEKEIVTFTCRGYAAYLQVGDVIAIADTNRHKNRYGGLVKAATTTQITLDFPVEIKQFNGFDDYFYLALYPDILAAVRNGSLQSAYQHYVNNGQAEGRHANGYLMLCFLPDLTVQMLRVTNPPGTHKVITVETGFTAPPPIDSTYIIITPENKQQFFKIQSKSVDNSDSDKLSLTCKQFSIYKFELIERNLVLGESRATTTAISQVQAPTNIVASFQPINSNPKKWGISLNWLSSRDVANNQDLFVTSYLVSFRNSSNVNWSIDLRVEQPNIDFEVTLTGTYSFKIKAVRFNGQTSEYTELKNAFVIS